MISRGQGVDDRGTRNGCAARSCWRAALRGWAFSGSRGSSRQRARRQGTVHAGWRPHRVQRGWQLRALARRATDAAVFTATVSNARRAAAAPSPSESVGRRARLFRPDRILPKTVAQRARGAGRSSPHSTAAPISATSRVAVDQPLHALAHVAPVHPARQPAVGAVQRARRRLERHGRSSSPRRSSLCVKPLSSTTRLRVCKQLTCSSEMSAGVCAFFLSKAALCAASSIFSRACFRRFSPSRSASRASPASHTSTAACPGRSTRLAAYTTSGIQREP